MKQKSLLTLLLMMFWVTAFSQNIKITGTITDQETDEVVVGASVSVKGAAKGTTSDANGVFSITVPKGAKLLISTVGYESTETVADQEKMDIKLKASNKSLSEVVVVGYGIQKKANLTGSVAQFKSEELTKRQVGTASNLLQGLAPGITVTQQSGKPGADGADIKIRGIGSIFSGTGPLILVYGIVSSMDNVDANTIESITVLKDAASTAIYGSRASNGVILVKTKRAGGKGLVVNYNVFVTQTSATNLPERTTAVEHMELSNVAQQNSTGNPAAFVFKQELIDKFKTTAPNNLDVFNTDWVKLLLTNSGIMQNHNLTVEAGNEKASLFTSISYLNQQGLVQNNSYNRFDLRMSPDIKISNTLRFSGNLNYTQGTRIEPAGSSPEFIIRQAIGLPATAAAKFGDGMYGDAGQSNRRNPLGQAEASGIYDQTIPTFFAKASLFFKPIKGLELEATYATERWTPHTKRFQKSFDSYNANVATSSYDLISRYPGTNSLTESYSTNIRNTYLAQATYQLGNANHEVKVTGGMQAEEFLYNSLGASRTDFVNENLPYLNLGGANRDNNGGAFENAIAGFFGRINYGFQGKYLVEVNGRYDGSSRFSQVLKQQWGFFPSASAGWIFSNESFFQNLSKVIQFGKIRASYGSLGNQNIGDNYPFASSYSSGADYYFNSTINSGFALTDAANAAITWEKSTQADIGLDLTLWKGLTITADYYVKTISDMLLKKPIPTYVGLNPAYLNLGSMENRGWEFTANYRNQIGKLKYNVTAAIGDVVNKVKSLPGVPYLDEGLNRSAVDYPLRSYFGYKAVGYFQSKDDIAASPTHFFTANPGDIKYADTNGDGKVNADDRVFIGNNFPRYEYSFNINFGYGAFDLNVFLQGVGQKENYISGTGAYPFYAADFIPSLLAIHKDYWTPTNPNAQFPRLLPTIGVNGTTSSFWVINSSYLRMKNLNIGYKLPKSVLSKLGISSARLYVSGQNLFTLTSFWKGFDPEINDNNAQFYPLMKTYTVGLNVKF